MRRFVSDRGNQAIAAYPPGKPVELAAVRAQRARHALNFVLLIGALSFFADFVYEGSRSVIGPYLASFGATATAIGVVTGFGELVGYTLRLASGRLADVTRRYWLITISGYVIQMASVPALALTRSWITASMLIVLERAGKAIRNPSRDVMLANAARHIGGYGWSFGLHQALDQFGAMIGPLVVALMLSWHGSYREAFAVLGIPALINLSLVTVARLLYPLPLDQESVSTALHSENFPRLYWLYLAGAMLVAAGFADYPLIAYHFSRTRVVGGLWIPAFYSVAMAVSGGGSLLLGRLFDRYGFRVLIALTALCAAFAPLVFLGNFWVALLGAAIWGLGMGVHESIIPAAVAPMVPPRNRASAFGLFTAGYGVSWFIGSAVIGRLYDMSVAASVGFCVVTELAAIPVFFAVARRQRRDAA